MQDLITWIVVGVSLVIIVAYVSLEVWAHKQDEDEKNKANKLLEAIAQKLGVNTSTILDNEGKDGKGKGKKRKTEPDKTPKHFDSVL